MATTPQPIQTGRSRSGIHIDLTPMVDLAFLLITFFLLTTALARPQVMPVVMPDPDPDGTPLLKKESQVLTLLLGARDRVYYYSGLDCTRLDTATFDPKGLRLVLLEKRQAVDRAWGRYPKPGSDRLGPSGDISRLTVLIKPTADASYGNVVDAFDEMKICGIDHYMLLEASPTELAGLR